MKSKSTVAAERARRARKNGRRVQQSSEFVRAVGAEQALSRRG